MSPINIQREGGEEVSIERLLETEPEDVFYHETRSILHGGYRKALGSVNIRNESYPVSVGERDDGRVYVQVREPENGILADVYVPDAELPEDNEQLYNLMERGEIVGF